MIVPLIADHDPLGAIFLIRRRPKHFTPEELAHVRVLGEMAALAIRRALSVETIRKMQSEEHFLSEASKILASSLDYSTTLKTVVKLAVPRIADWCMVHLLEDGKIRTAEIAHTDPAKQKLFERIQEQYPPRAGASLIVEVINTGKSQLHREIPDELPRKTAQTPEHWALLQEMKLKSVIWTMPLSSHLKAGAFYCAVSHMKVACALK
jgi:GAF domain-containing protein